ncbi:hypothetical protein Thimo_1671 [Thioflavicoccus mobilis 8321]|uniref:Uncharacterized protein n=1 Tax=Thioflavicoccus mobilis 8321 TaxID=765912 RepID=L0GUJ3_9GAMM|nr:hypothetical protein Thimo_1671 [Thioflavicoccus mobilis 8321]
MMMTSESNHPFLSAFRGGFTAALRWHQLDELWARVREDADAGWFLYVIGEPPPTAAAGAAEVLDFVAALDAHLRATHHEDFCGIVYADDLGAPTFIKIYDPGRLGVFCGFSDAPPLPGWIMSRIAPVDLVALEAAAAKRKRPWWRRRRG